MARPKTNVLIFTGMYCEKYGAVERYNVELTKQLVSQRYQPIFVYNALNEVESYSNDLKQNGAQILIVSPNISGLKLTLALLKIIKRYNPYLIHTHFNPKIVRLVHYLSFLLNVPQRLNTFHGMAQSKKLITKVWMRSLNYLCTHQIAISNAIRNEQISIFKTSKHKITTIRLGLDKTIFKKVLTKQEIKAKYQLPTDGLLIGNVAFHNPIKGVDVLLDAFGLLLTKTKENIYICQVGSFSESHTTFLKQKAKALGISNKIIWMGIQNNVPQLLQAFDIYVQPSRSEGLGLAILEAYFSKLPVVASNIGGIPEIVDNNKGLLFESENAEDLAEQIQKLVVSKTLRYNKAEKGYEFITNNYDLTQQVKVLIDFYIKP